MSIASPRSGGQILIDQLVVQGVGHVYCVPGESYLAALDALHDSAIEVVVCRQEAGAAMAALTVGRLTGRLEYASLRAGRARPTRHMASISPNMIQRR